MMEQTERGTYRFGINHQPSGGKEWVAEIKGTHPKYRFDRAFSRDVGLNWSSSGKTGTTYFEVEEGRFYEVNIPWKDRYFFCVRGGEQVRLTASQVFDALSREGAPA